MTNTKKVPTRFGNYYSSVDHAYKMLAKGAKVLQEQSLSQIGVWKNATLPIDFKLGTKYRVKPEVVEFDGITINFESETKTFQLKEGAAELIEKVIKDNGLIIENPLHKHHDIIMQWLYDADGKYDLYLTSKEDGLEWKIHNVMPRWSEDCEYELREKLDVRMFEEFAWYPVKTYDGETALCQCVRHFASGNTMINHFECNDFLVAESECEWIGAQVKVEWPQ